MRAGLVVSIRVNPKDCQSVLDVMETVGIDTNGQSFSQLVSLTLSSLLESSRIAAQIPEPDDFQYLNRMQYYIGRQRTSKKVKIAKLLHDGGGRLHAPALPQRSKAAEIPAELSAPIVVTELTLEQREAGRRLEELLTKKSLSEDNPAVIWQVEDQKEYDVLYSIVYPEG